MIGSSGQLIHGDALFIKPPEDLVANGRPAEDLVRLALLADVYGDTDLLVATLRCKTVQDYFLTNGLNAERIIGLRKKYQLREARKAGFKNRLRDLKSFLLGHRV